MFLCLRRDERGVIAVIAALMLTAVVGMAALVVDLGWLYVVRSELQNSADTGALAGVVELLLSSPAVAEATAVEYATRPAHFHLTKPPPGAGAVAVTIDDDDDEFWLRVRVGPSQVPTIFARVLGIQTSDVAAVAVAELREVIGTGPGNLLPFGIHKDMVETAADNLEDNLGSSINVYPDPGNPGNFGLLDFDGGANSNADTVNWIEYGYGDSFVIPESTGFLQVSGTTGISGTSLSGAISSRLGDRVLLPVFDDEVTGQGANASFRVVDFVGGIIQSFQLTGNVSERHITVQLVDFASSNLIVGGDDEIEDEGFNVLAPVLIQ